MKISISKIHYFNPGHEVAVWLNNPNYTPPKAVSKMIEDLSLLPIWYGEKGDKVIINETISSSRFLLTIPKDIRPLVNPATLSEVQNETLSDNFLEATPWGISPHSIQFFKKIRNENIIIPQWKNEYIQLVNRKTAAECLSIIQDQNKSLFPISKPYFCSKLSDVYDYFTNNKPPFILKTPYSCSGRGIYWLHENSLDKQAILWIERWLKKQNSISIEPALSKVCDFAMEFKSDEDGIVSYEGLSVFKTKTSGAFSACILHSQKNLEKFLLKYISKNLLLKIQESVRLVLSKKIGPFYKGYLGVDMLIYKLENNYFIHPFIEINLRNTMGLVAIKLNKLIHPESSGTFQLDFYKFPTDLATFNQESQKQFPLIIEDRKIKSGYLSLCPITTQTQYIAYIKINKREFDIR